MPDKKEDLPIDRGWSWVICFASFFCMFIMGTSMQAVSVLFLELVVEFGSSITVTSLTFMCFIMALSVSSVISTSVLVPMFGERPVVVVSGFLFAVGSIGYFLAPNIIVFIAFAAGKGTCMGMIFVPSISLLSRYFYKRRSLATTICNSGICVASILSPPIIRVITAEYGMRGTLLILGAVELHMVAAALLMRPVSSYRVIPIENNNQMTVDESKATLINPTSQMRKASVKPETGPCPEENSNTVSMSLPDEHNLSGPMRYDRNFNNFSFNDHKRYNTNIALSDTELRNGDRENLEIESLLSDEKPSSHHMAGNASVPRTDSLRQPSVRRSSYSTGYAPTGKVTHHESMLSVINALEPALSGVGVDDSAPAEVQNQGWRSCCCIAIVRRIFDPYLFSQWSYRVFLISCVPCATVQFLLQYIPTIAVIKGATKDEAATLVTIIGSVDLVSRMAVGVFADTKLLKASHIVVIFQVCQGILCQFNPLFDTFEKMIAMVVLMGLFIGTRQSLMAMMHIEIVGMEKMARCLSLSAMVATISAASHSPILSAVMEATGSYNIVLYYVGIALIFGSFLILVATFLDKGDKQQQTEKGQHNK